MSEVPRSANLVVGLIESDPGLLEEVKQNPVPTLKRLAAKATESLPPPAFITDKFVYRLVVVILGAVVISAMIGVIGLTMIGKSSEIPDVVTALGAAAIGALAGLLAPSPSSK